MKAMAAHSLVTRLWAGLDDLTFIPGRWNKFFSYPKQPDQVWDPSMGTVGLFPGYGGKAVMPTAHLPLKPRFRMNGPVPPLPVYTFMACRDTTVSLCSPTALCMCTTSRTQQPQTLYVSRPISSVYHLLYTHYIIPYKSVVISLPMCPAQPLPRMTSSHVMYVHKDNTKHTYRYFKPAIKLDIQLLFIITYASFHNAP
jgi:hypothetical protein